MLVPISGEMVAGSPAWTWSQCLISETTVSKFVAKNCSVIIQKWQAICYNYSDNGVYQLDLTSICLQYFHKTELVLKSTIAIHEKLTKLVAQKNNVL